MGREESSRSTLNAGRRQGPPPTRWAASSSPPTWPDEEAVKALFDGASAVSATDTARHRVSTTPASPRPDDDSILDTGIEALGAGC